MSKDINIDDLDENFIKKIDEALGIGSVSKGPSLGAASEPSTGSIGKKLRKEKKKAKAKKVEDDVLESG